MHGNNNQVYFSNKNFPSKKEKECNEEHDLISDEMLFQFDILAEKAVCFP